MNKFTVQNKLKILKRLHNRPSQMKPKENKIHVKSCDHHGG